MNTESKKFFYSIVISSYNGSGKIGAAINSLKLQDYTGKFEILVVDDRSTDNTSAIALALGIKVISTKESRGLSGARNAGLDVAQGDVYVCFDDDCIAEKNWLTELDNAYTLKPNALGMGSVIVSSKNQSFTDKYIEESGYTKPILPGVGGNKSALGRFLAYYKSMFGTWDVPENSMIKVHEIAGGLSSFFIKDLKAIGGWNTEVSGYEDVDICKRLSQKFPGREFFVTSSAKMVHDHKLELHDYLRKHYIRSGVRLKYYLANKMTPPIYPFPFVYIATILGIQCTILFISNSISVSLALNLSILLLSAIFLPSLIYPWWIYKAIKKQDLGMLAFSWVQMVYESLVMVGMLKAHLIALPS